MTDCQNKTNSVFELRDGETLENYHAPYKGFYVFQHKGKIYYSKRIKPLVEKFKLKWEFNYENANHFLLTGLYIKNETLIRQISYVPGPWNIKNSKQRLHLIQNYNPYVKKKLQKQSSKEHYIEFEKIYTREYLNAIYGQKRSALLLSSGYDSNSILQIAQKTNTLERLISFTHIPLANTNMTELAKWNGNEKEKVIEIASYLDFKDVNFTNSENQNISDTVNYFSNELIEPVYGTANLNWMFDIFQSSIRKGVSNILIGGLGNLTISWNGYTIATLKMTYIYILKLLKSYKNINTFNQGNFINIKKSKYHFIDSNSIRNISLIKKTHHKKFRLKIIGYSKKIRTFQYSPIEDLLNININDITTSKKVINFTMNLYEKHYRGSENDYKKLAKSIFTDCYAGLLKNNKRGQQGVDILQRTLNERETLKMFLTNDTDIKTQTIINKSNILKYLNELEQQTNTLNTIIRCNVIWRVYATLTFRDKLISMKTNST